MRLYQDRLARLINFRKEHHLKDEHSEQVSEELSLLIDFYTPAKQPYIDDFKVIQNYNYQPVEQIREPPVVSTPIRQSRPTLTPSLTWDDETLGFSPKNTPNINNDQKKSAKKNRELHNLQIPNYMMPKQSTRRQKGSGPSKRLYVLNWIQIVIILPDKS